MRDPARIDRMLSLIRAIWSKSPDLRLGQLLCNANTHNFESNTYQCDDDDLENDLKAYCQRFAIDKPTAEKSSDEANT